VLEAHARQELPFDVLASRLAEEDGVDAASIAQVFFIMQNARGPFTLPGVAIRSFGNSCRDGQAVLPLDHAWLTVTLRETLSGIVGSCSHKPDLFETQSHGPWMADYKKILAQVAANPEMPLLRLAAY
jgi:hypothetical protein